MNLVWNHSAVRITHVIPQKMRLPLGAAGAIAVILVGAFATEETADNTRSSRAISLFGLLVILAGVFATSTKHSAVKWQTVIVGMLSQFIIALFVLRTGVGYDIFSFIGELAGDLLGFAGQGVAFLTSEAVANNHMFIVGVVPAVIFFVAITQVLYYCSYPFTFVHSPLSRPISLQVRRTEYDWKS